MRRRRASLDVPEPDGAVHQEKVVLRYCSPQAIALEKQHHGGNFKRIRMQSVHHHLRNVNRISRPPVEEEFMPVEGGGMMELEMVMEFFNQKKQISHRLCLSFLSAIFQANYQLRARKFHL
jgi:hypothetical protein